LQHAAERRAAVTAEREDEKNLRIQWIPGIKKPLH
jgi:hypothetical protein